MTQAFEGQVVVVQAADLIQSRKLVPDLATWMQCFGLFTAAVARKRPESIPDLMAYMTIIARASQKYRWPSWVIYDQNFRLEVAGNPDQVWAKVDPSIYAQCFTGQSVSPENWCSQCQGLDQDARSSQQRGFGATPGVKCRQEARPQQGCTSQPRPECRHASNTISITGTANMDEMDESAGILMSAVAVVAPTQLRIARSLRIPNEAADQHMLMHAPCYHFRLASAKLRVHS